MNFGNYEILSQLAVGGMSEVFLARPVDAEDIEELVVIKRILPALAEDERFVELFSEEARIAKLMDHPNVVRILDSGTIDNKPFIAMEHVDGLDCWRMVHRCTARGKTPPARASIFVVCEVLRALDHVHNARDDSGRHMKVVHGDVSPTNVYISRTGEVKLGDFGIARAQHRDLSQRKSMLKGKVAYMAPEQVMGGDFDHRADLFSSGTVLTELLIQTRLFGGGSQLTTLLAIRDVRLDVMESNKDKIPEGLELIIRRALARDREERFPTAISMCRILEQFFEDAPQEELRDELAELVEVALEVAPQATSSRVPAPVATPLPDEAEIDKLRSSSPPEVVRIVDDEQLVQEEIIITVELEEPLEELPRTPVGGLDQFIFRKADGSTLGPLTYAAALDEVIADRIRSSWEVSVGGGPFKPLVEVRELARHSPSLTPVTAEFASVGPPDRRGLLDVERVWSVFFGLATAKETGIAIFDNESIRKEVYFKDGKIHCVKSNVSDELLGNTLAKTGVINKAQLEFALEALPQFNNHLGDALIGLHILEPVTLFRYISEQVRAKLIDIFTWKSGEYSLYRGVENPNAAFPLHIDTLSILWDGIKKALSDSIVRQWLKKHESMIVTFVENASVHTVDLDVPEGPASVLDFVTRPMTVGLVTKMASSEPEQLDVARALCLACDLNLAELAVTTPSKQPEKKGAL